MGGVREVVNAAFEAAAAKVEERGLPRVVHGPNRDVVGLHWLHWPTLDGARRHVMRVNEYGGHKPPLLRLAVDRGFGCHDWWKAKRYPHLPAEHVDGKGDQVATEIELTVKPEELTVAAVWVVERVLAIDGQDFRPARPEWLLGAGRYYWSRAAAIQSDKRESEFHLSRKEPFTADRLQTNLEEDIQHEAYFERLMGIQWRQPA